MSNQPIGCLHYISSHSDPAKRSIVYCQIVKDDIEYWTCFMESCFQMQMFEVKSRFFVLVFLLIFLKINTRELKFTKPMNVLTELKLRKEFT